MACVVENLEPAEWNFSPARGSPNDAASESEGKIWYPARAQRHHRRRQGPSVVGCGCIEEIRLRQTSHHPAEFNLANRGGQRMRAAQLQMRKARRVVTHHQRVIDSRAPPLIFGGEAKPHRSEVRENGRLAEPECAA